MDLVIVEDVEFIRYAIGVLWQHQPDCRVVGEAAAVAEAVEVILRTRPHLVVLDIGLQGEGDGFTVVDEVRRQGMEPRWLVFSESLQPYVLYRAQTARVHGYLDKRGLKPEVVAEAARQIAANGTYFSERYLEAKRRCAAEIRRYGSMLSELECAVLSLIGRGENDATIAALLGMSASTAQGHRSRLLQKLGIESSPKLVAYAVQSGFTRNPLD